MPITKMCRRCRRDFQSYSVGDDYCAECENPAKAETDRLYLKRLDSPEGAERRLVPTTRSEEEPDDVEQRSAEGSAVPPGKAQEALCHAMWLLTREADALQETVEVLGKGGEPKFIRFETEASAEIREQVNVLFALLPKPDSDAR